MIAPRLDPPGPRDLAVLQAVLESLPDAVLLCSANGTIEAASSRMAELSGWARHELVGRPIEDLVPAGHRGMHRHQRAKAIEAPRIREMAGRPLRLLRRDGRERLVEIRLAPSVVGSETWTTAVVRDVSDRVERFLAGTADENQRSQELLLATVLHEVGNALVAVTPSLDDAARIAEGGAARELDELAALLADAREGVARIHDVVRDLRQLSTRTCAPCSSELKSVVESSLRLVRRSIPHGTDVATSYGEDVTAVVHRGRLGQVLVNLLLNACHALGEAPPDRRRLELRVARCGHVVEIDVGDTGPGIPTGAHELIFEPFYTTKPKGEGTGLGLAVSRSIVRAMGGELGLVPREAGACFRVTLPS